MSPLSSPSTISKSSGNENILKIPEKAGCFPYTRTVGRVTGQRKPEKTGLNAKRAQGEVWVCSCCSFSNSPSQMEKRCAMCGVIHDDIRCASSLSTTESHSFSTISASSPFSPRSSKPKKGVGDVGRKIFQNHHNMGSRNDCFQKNLEVKLSGGADGHVYSHGVENRVCFPSFPSRIDRDDSPKMLGLKRFDEKFIIHPPSQEILVQKSYGRWDNLPPRTEEFAHRGRDDCEPLQSFKGELFGTETPSSVKGGSSSIKTRVKGALSDKALTMSFASWNHNDCKAWTCVFCTFENDNVLHLTCAVCGTNRDYPGTQRDQVSTLNDSLDDMSFETDALLIPRELMQERINELVQIQREMMQEYEREAAAIEPKTSEVKMQLEKTLRQLSCNHTLRVDSYKLNRDDAVNVVKSQSHCHQNIREVEDLFTAHGKRESNADSFTSELDESIGLTQQQENLDEWGTDLK